MAKETQSKWGPGMLVTAAFIGPGTVLTASKSGAGFGYGLLWVVLFSILAAIVFQEMAARLGIVTGKDLSVTLGQFTKKPLLRWSMIGLILAAVLIGNAAYQAGNIAGAVTGLETLTNTSKKFWAITIGLVAAVVLWTGRLKLIQNILIVLVAIMSLLFLVSAIIVGPDFGAVAKGLLVPSFDKESIMVVIGLLGTTVVPYNLFLHSRSAVENWHLVDADEESQRMAVRQSRLDTSLAIGLGGLITMMILITAAAAFFEKGISFGKLPEIAEQLRPVLGSTSEFIFCLGLTAAGLTSAITAPLAAGIVAAGCFGWGSNIRDPRTFSVMMAIIAIGVSVILFTAKGVTPSDVILIAQVANGLIMPIVAAFLLWVMNRSDSLGKFKNGPIANGLAVVLLLIVSLIAFRNFTGIKSKIQKRLSPPEIEVRFEQSNIASPQRRSSNSLLFVTHVRQKLENRSGSL